MPFTTSVDSIRTLGGATNGPAIVGINDFKTGLQRIADDLNAYYLLGYTSSNGKADGKYPQDQGHGEAARRAGPGPRGLPGAPDRLSAGVEHVGDAGCHGAGTRRRRSSPPLWAG